MTPNQIAALSAEVMRVLQSQPELGINGYHCEHTQSAANFPTDRAAAFQPDFVRDVATILDCMTYWPPGIVNRKTGREYRGMCNADFLGAVVVAFIITGVKFSRIPGSPDIAIARRRGGAI